MMHPVWVHFLFMHFDRPVVGLLLSAQEENALFLCIGMSSAAFGMARNVKQP